LPTRLRDPEISLGAWHAGVDRISDPFGHRSKREAPVEAEAVATEVSPGVLDKVEGMKGADEAGFEVPQQRIDPAELWQVVGVLPVGDMASWLQPAVVTE